MWEHSSHDNHHRDHLQADDPRIAEATHHRPYDPKDSELLQQAVFTIPSFLQEKKTIWFAKLIHGDEGPLAALSLQQARYISEHPRNLPLPLLSVDSVALIQKAHRKPFSHGSARFEKSYQFGGFNSAISSPLSIHDLCTSIRRLNSKSGSYDSDAPSQRWRFKRRLFF